MSYIAKFKGWMPYFHPINGQTVSTTLPLVPRWVRNFRGYFHGTLIHFLYSSAKPELCRMWTFSYFSRSVSLHLGHPTPLTVTSPTRTSVLSHHSFGSRPYYLLGRLLIPQVLSFTLYKILGIKRGPS